METRCFLVLSLFLCAQRLRRRWLRLSRRQPVRSLQRPVRSWPGKRAPLAGSRPVGPPEAGSVPIPLSPPPSASPASDCQLRASTLGRIVRR